MKKRLMIMLGIGVVSAFVVAGCGSDTETGKEPSEVVLGEAEEDYFEWSGNIIIGLTEKGMKQKKLIIPERCEGFNCMLLNGEEVKVESLSFESEKDITLNGALGSAENLEVLVLPEELSKIGDFEFYMCPKLKEITIPESVLEIGEYAFQNDESLETVIFSGGTTAIGANAFVGCGSLSSVKFSDTLSTVGDYAFYECKELKEVRFPNSISEIGAMAFMNSGVEDVYFPENVELSILDTTSFVQVSHSVTIHVSQGSWMDLNFEQLFDGPYVKSYE